MPRNSDGSIGQTRAAWPIGVANRAGAKRMRWRERDSGGLAATALGASKSRLPSGRPQGAERLHRIVITINITPRP
ncbi:MAG: hypothetical protein RL701_1471 [Pseudomonadota bacterium]